jgi:undecaprenyl pyrophosphate synthase
MRENASAYRPWSPDILPESVVAAIRAAEAATAQHDPMTLTIAAATGVGEIVDAVQGLSQRKRNKEHHCLM